MNKLFILLFALLALPTIAQEKIKVACVGNSVTYGYKVENRETNCYPAQLQLLLGDQFEVKNFGHSGATLLRKGHRPYMNLPEFRAAMDFKADWVVIHLGLNDTDPRNWPNYRQEFVGDYYALIDSMRTANPNAQIWICRMTPISHDHPRYLSGTRDWHAQIQKAIEQVAENANVGLIDLFTPFHKRYDLYPDALHPNVEGARMLAEIVYANITGNHGGLKVPATYSDNMVLQRDQPICISGTANKGANIKVKFAGMKAKTKASANGEWSVNFKALPAGGPYELTIETDDERLHYQNVWMGDVWICSGQSNMEFPLASSINGKADAELATQKGLLHLYHMQPITTTYDVEWDEATLQAVNRNAYYHPAKWELSNADAALKFSAIAYHFGRMLTDSLKVHIGLVLNAVGGSTTESWIDRTTLEWEFPNILYRWTKGDFGQEWARKRAVRNIAASKNPLQRHSFMPHYLFDAGMMPLNRMACKGVIWYQGESNAHNIELHEQLFTLMEKSWRKFFNNEQLPFYMVQLSSINRPSWPHFRDSQRRLAQQLPHTWMAVSSDHGDAVDVHPRNKRPIGERLALQALKNTYGYHIIAAGPEYLSHQTKGSAIFVNFANANGLQASDGGAIQGFEIAGKDGIFHPAEAQVKGSSLRLTSQQVKHPVYARYAWVPNAAKANLVNAQGLPASTFTTE